MCAALVLIAASTAAIGVAGQSLDLSRYTIVDLSHAYGPSTVFWRGEFLTPSGFFPIAGFNFAREQTKVVQD